jgi:RIO kinase 2
MGNVEKVFQQCIDCIIRFAKYGLIHGDFNEFNIIVSEDENITVIDFPQMVKITLI